MSKVYKKKSSPIVRAEVFNSREDPATWPEGVYRTGTGHAIKTPWGIAPVADGSYILADPDGSRYPCDPEVFARDYEPVE